MVTFKAILKNTITQASRVIQVKAFNGTHARFLAKQRTRATEIVLCIEY